MLFPLSLFFFLLFCTISHLLCVISGGRKPPFISFTMQRYEKYFNIASDISKTDAFS